MKKMLKIVFSATLILAVLLSFAACSGTVGNTEWQNNISVVQRRKAEAHSPLSSYKSLEEASKLSLKDENNGNYMSLNGVWDFSYTTKTANIPADFMKDSFVTAPGTVTPATRESEELTWAEITVPGVWEAQGFGEAVYTPVSRYPWDSSLTPASVPEENAFGLYKRTFDVPAEWNGSRVAVSFEGVQSAFYVYINGEFAGYAEDSFTTKDFDITKYVKAGQTNTIAVQVVKYSDGSWLEAADSIKYGGIYRDVYLTAFPENKIMDVALESVLNDDFSSAMLQTTVSLANYTDKVSDGNTVKVSVYDADGNLVAAETQLGTVVKYSSKKTADLYFSGEIGGRVNIDSPKLWTAETPYLYTAVIALYDTDGNLLDVTNQKVGIRSLGLATDDEGHQSLTINGKRIVLYGINYNEHDAETGLTVSPEKMLSDVKMMKELNINAVRSPGRSLSPEFLDLCDEYGIYVIEDASISSNPYSDKEDQSIPGDQSIWQTAILDRLISVMERDKNHASVVTWSVANNSGSGSQINFLKTYLQQNDSRLLIYDGMESVTDIMVAYEWDMTSVYEYINETSNKKPIIVQTDALGLLNGAGSVDAYVDLFMNNEAAQGGFLANWIDYAVKGEDGKLVYSDDLSDGYLALKGILSADRTLQSDAEEFRRAYSPIVIKAVNAAAGQFAVSNRNLFTSLDNYVITYDIYAGGDKVSSGTVSDISAAPGENAQFTVVYGDLLANTEYFIDFTVKYKNNPSWADADVLVTSSQFEITSFATTPKTQDSNTSGNAFSVTSFVVPKVTTSYVNAALGEFWFSNQSLADLNQIFDLSYRIIENNTQSEYMQVNGDSREVWKSPGEIVYTEGKFDAFSVPAGADNYKITIPYVVNGVSTGEYLIELTLTTKTAIGEVPAGYEIVYTFDKDSLGENIPFRMDPSRTPVGILDENGKIVNDEETMYPLMTGGDPIVNTKPEYVAKSYAGEFGSFMIIDNGNVSVTVDLDTGMFKKYSVGGNDIFTPNASSPIGSFTRQPTGGDLLGGYSSASNNSLLSTVSSSADGKKLKGNARAERISDSHWRITADYALASYPYGAFENSGLKIDYSVIYDLYANGEIVVNVSYDSNAETNIDPYEISNILTLSDVETMTWFGRGPGESYGDKLASSRVGLFENIKVKDQIEDYLAMTESGNKSDVRWIALKNASGNGVMISSDSSNFDVNVTKWYPWARDSYSRDSLDRANTIVKITGASRGINSGKLSESVYYESGSYINPGMKYSFNYKLSPITADTSLTAKAAERITDSAVVSGENKTIVSGTAYALRNIASSSLFLSVGEEGNLLMNPGIGSDKQIWIKEATETMVPDTFTLRNVGLNKYLTPVSYYQNGISAELGFGDYKGFLWQNFLQDNTNELYSAGFYYALTPVSYDSKFIMGSRVAIMPRDSREEAAWKFIPVEGTENRYLIQNSKTGYYLTAADSISYRNAYIAEIAGRIRNYAPTVNWSLFESFSSASPAGAGYTGDDWIETNSTVTQWQLLPGNAQKWVFTQSGNGYTIRNSVSGRYLNVTDGNLTESDSATEFTARQENGKFYLYDAASNLALTGKNSSAGGLVISLEPMTSSPSQLWDLASDSELGITVEIGDEWFNVGTEQIKAE